MTSRASEAGKVLAELKLAIAAEGANYLNQKDYKAPNVEQAKTQLAEQEVRIERFTELTARFNILDQEIKAEDPAPVPEDPRWGEIQTIKGQSEEMRWEGRNKEFDGSVVISYDGNAFNADQGSAAHSWQG